MKVLGLIPARGGSQGIKRKNIKVLNGKPLIAYTIDQALNSRLLTSVVVSTDNDEIAKVASSFGAQVPFLRPEALASSTAKSIDVVLHALDYFKENGVVYDAVCLLQATSPFRPKGTIDASIKSFFNQKGDSLVSLRRVPDHFNPYWTFLKGKDGSFSRAISDGELISRRQDLPNAYHRDGAIYIVRTDFLRRHKKLVSDDTLGYEIQSPALINIDGPDDWSMAEKYMELCS